MRMPVIFHARLSCINVGGSYGQDFDKEVCIALCIEALCIYSQISKNEKKKKTSLKLPAV